MIGKQKKVAAVDENGNKRPSVVKSIIVFALFLLYMIPFLLVIVNSLKSKISIIKYPLQLVDEKGPQFESYVNAFEDMDFLQAFGNSIFVVALSVLLLMVFSSMCAYILVRKNYLACKVSFLLLISYMVVPFQVIMIPLLSIYGGVFSILNSRVTLILMNFGFGTCFAVFLCHGFIKTSVPVALEEAALIDGCGPLQTFFRIVFPLLKPILSTVMILQVLGLWNDYLLPSLVLVKPELHTLPIAIRTFVGTFSSDYGNMMAALVMTVVPVIIVYIALQKYIIGGVVAGAVKS